MESPNERHDADGQKSAAQLDAKRAAPMRSGASRALLWLGTAIALLAVFAWYGQLELVLRWVEMKLC